MLEAANADEEALAIAIALREAVETPHKTAALVTPDRALARRVLAALERWQVPVDNSGGDALPATPAGVFARLAVDAAFGGLAPVPLLALLKHPLIRLGADAGKYAAAVAALERAVFRGPRPRPGSAGLAGALATLRVEIGKVRRKEASDLHRSDPRIALMDWQLDAAEELVTRLTAALRPLEEIAASPRSFADIAARHRAALAELSADASGAPAAFAGFDGEALAAAFDEIALDPASARFALAPRTMPSCFSWRSATARCAGRSSAACGFASTACSNRGCSTSIASCSAGWSKAYGRHRRGPIRGSAGRCGTRSASICRSGAFRSPPHDFAQALGAGEVMLSYPAKLSGAPTVVSRFVQRLAAVGGRDALDGGAAARRQLLPVGAHARSARQGRARSTSPRRSRRAPLAPHRFRSPRSRPGCAIPYTIYAKHVLRLRELDAIDLPPGAADRGTLIHGAVGDFTEASRGGAAGRSRGRTARVQPRDIRRAGRLSGGERVLAAALPADRALVCRVETRAPRRRLRKLHAEVRGAHRRFRPATASFRLSARADRIEQHADGRYAILDYKTGTPPTEKQVRIGMAPQLTLEAAMLRGGGFDGIAKGASIAELAYVALRGVEPPGEFKPIEFKDGDAQSHAERALGKLKELVAQFEDEAQPYRPLVLSMWKNRYGTYDHLARVKEWSVGEEEEEW